MDPVEIGPVPPERRRQSPGDLFLIFAGANVVASTLLTGASMGLSFDAPTAMGLIVAGTLAGSLLVAALAPVGPRYGAPSLVVARAAFGRGGAALLALLLFLGNFAWIALNNVVAASALAPLVGGGSHRWWSAALGLLATAVVAAGPAVVRRADRVAVPVMAATGLLLAVHLLRTADPLRLAPATDALPWPRGLDVVVAYQVSWILMFADYSRYTPSARASAVAVFSALTLSSLWFMPLGAFAALLAGTSDPGRMMAASGTGAVGALLLALGTLTTNFVNVYLSALALKSVVKRAPTTASVWAIGGAGTLLGLFGGTWLERYADFMLVLGGLLVPAGGVLLWRFFVSREPVDVPALYAERGPYSGVRLPAVVAWAAGGLVYYAAAGIGGTLPALAVAVALAAVLSARRRAGASRWR